MTPPDRPTDAATRRATGRRGPALGFDALREAGVGLTDDPAAEAILDAAVDVVQRLGMRKATVEEIAAQADLGRTTVYRRFGGREAILQAVVAREGRRWFTAIAAAVDPAAPVADQVVDGMLQGLRAAEASPIGELVRSEPDLLRLLTVDLGPFLAAAVEVMVTVEAARRGGEPDERTRAVAEMLVRWAVSLVLAPESCVPLDDDTAARRVLHLVVDPLLAS